MFPLRNWPGKDVQQAGLVRDPNTAIIMSDTFGSDQYQASLDKRLAVIASFCVFSDRVMVGVEKGDDSLLHVWCLHTGDLIFSLEDYPHCQVDMLVSVSDGHHDYLLIYFNNHEPLHRLHVFKVLSLIKSQKWK